MFSIRPNPGASSEECGRRIQKQFAWASILAWGIALVPFRFLALTCTNAFPGNKTVEILFLVLGGFLTLFCIGAPAAWLLFFLLDWFNNTFK